MVFSDTGTPGSKTTHSPVGPASGSPSTSSHLVRLGG